MSQIKVKVYQYEDAVGEKLTDFVIEEINLLFPLGYVPEDELEQTAKMTAAGLFCPMDLEGGMDEQAVLVAEYSFNVEE